MYIYIYMIWYYINDLMHCTAFHDMLWPLGPLVLIASIVLRTQVTLRFPCNFLSRRQRLRITDGFHDQFESLEETYSRWNINSAIFGLKLHAPILLCIYGLPITSGRADCPFLRDRDQCGRAKRRQSFTTFAAFTAAAIARAEGTAWGTLWCRIGGGLADSFCWNRWVESSCPLALKPEQWKAHFIKCNKHLKDV